MFYHVLNELGKMRLLSHIGQSCFGTIRLVPATFQIDQFAVGTNQAILSLIKRRQK